jgi:hypothetical protein
MAKKPVLEKVCPKPKEKELTPSVEQEALLHSFGGFL